MKLERNSLASQPAGDCRVDRRTKWLSRCLVLLLVAFGSFGSPACLAAQQDDIVDPASLGFDVKELQRIDRLMKAAVKNGEMVGCSAMIVKDDKVCYYQQWGQANRKKEAEVTRDNIWRIYSMSKPITTVAAMQLVEQGKMKLDDEVAKYLPKFANQKVLVAKGGGFEEVPARRTMTIRDLMRHSSGLTYGFFGDSEVDTRYRKAGILILQNDLEAMADKLAELPLKHQPGYQFEYSVSTDLLGRVVEVVGEQPFDEYLQANVFDPLGMKDTSFVVPKEKLPRLAEMYQPSRRGGLVPAPSMSSIRFVSPQNKFYSGGGGLCSSIDDYKQFCRMLLNKGKLNGKQVVTQASLAEMWTNQIGELDRSSRQFKFGLGFSISNKGDYSWGGAAGTRFWVNPEKNLAMIFMVQNNPSRGRHPYKMRDIIYDSLK